MDADWDWLRQLGAVALVMGLLAAAMWALHKAGWFNAGIASRAGVGGPSQRPVGRIGSALRGVLRGRVRHGYFTHESSNFELRKITNVDRLALTPQHFLHVVRVAQRDLLLATYPQGCALVADLGKAPDLSHAKGLGITPDLDPDLDNDLSNPTTVSHPADERAFDLGSARSAVADAPSAAARSSSPAAESKVGVHV